MALLTGKDELKMIYQAIKSTRKDAALDLLDGILDYKLRKRLIPILDLVIHKRYNLHALRAIDQKPMNKTKITNLFKQLKDEKLMTLHASFNVKRNF